MKIDQKLKRALVTGATGYVGSNLVKHLIVEGWDVHVVVRKNSDLGMIASEIPHITIHQHDGSTSSMVNLVSKAKPEFVFHLASLFLAQHQPNDIEALIESNLLFSTQLVEAMHVNGIRYLINTGTSWQHFDNEEYNPVNLYSATKQAFEDILNYYCQAESLKATTLLLFDTYGPTDPRPKLISLLWKVALTNESLQMSPGEQLIDLVYISDVVKAYTTAAALLQTQENLHLRYGISSGKPQKLKEIIATFEKITCKKLNIDFGGRPYRKREVMIPWLSYSLLPGWNAEVSFEEGIRKTQQF